MTHFCTSYKDCFQKIAISSFHGFFDNYLNVFFKCNVLFPPHYVLLYFEKPFKVSQISAISYSCCSQNRFQRVSPWIISIKLYRRPTPILNNMTDTIVCLCQLHWNFIFNHNFFYYHFPQQEIVKRQNLEKTVFRPSEVNELLQHSEHSRPK